MFHESTQMKYWIFESPQVLENIRESKYENIPNISAEDEKQILLYYDRLVREFCDTCKPRIPRPTMATACAYLKRIYLHNNIFEYPPEGYYRTCIYLACKVDEFNLKADDFWANFRSQGFSSEKADAAITQIIKTELKVISLLDYSLIVHSPYRPMEGFIISLKHFCVQGVDPADQKTISSIVAEIDKLSAKADNFILWSLATDVCFLYSPPQIALAALFYASKNTGLVDITAFIRSITQSGSDLSDYNRVSDKVSTIVDVVKMLKLPNKETIDTIFERVNEIRTEQMKYEHVWFAICFWGF